MKIIENSERTKLELKKFNEAGNKLVGGMKWGLGRLEPYKSMSR